MCESIEPEYLGNCVGDGSASCIKCELTDDAQVFQIIKGTNNDHVA